MTAPEEIQQEIERTREHLGQTVEELAAKADVKARARARATEMKAKVQARASGVSGQMKQGQLARDRWPLVAVAVGVTMMASALILRQRKA
jgi:predicted transcriptional regulator